MLTVDDPRVDPNNPSCLSNGPGRRDPFRLFIPLYRCAGKVWQFAGSSVSPRSALTLYAGSLATNRMFQFMVIMTYRPNLNRQAKGYLLVHVDNTRPQTIGIT